LTLALAGAPVTPVVAQDGGAPAQDRGEIVDAGSGASIMVPAGWRLSRSGEVAVLTAPEGDASVAIVPVAKAEGGDGAVTSGWAAFKPGFARTVRVAQDLPARDGWDARRVVTYETSPAEKLAIQGMALRRGDAWTVVLVEGAVATLAKRGGQLNQAFDSLRPKGHTKENFAGRAAHKLDETRILELKDFLRRAMDELGVPGVGLALIENGKIVYEGGLGVKEVGTADLVDEHTRFMVASNTKGMATLLLSTLVDEGKLGWNQHVTQVYPEFRLGSAETTSKVLVKHLVCACTGLPRKDMQWIFNTAPGTPATDAFTQLAATEPTSGFGEVFQYNNLMATAAGYVGAHLIHPGMEVGAAFDKAMQERIFDPLGMAATTFDNGKALAGNWAKPHDFALDGTIIRASMQLNSAIGPYRPAGGAWSTTHDMALYVINELNEGVLPGGKRLVSKENLFARRTHNVSVGENRWYGMGLFDDRAYGVSVIQHGGSLVGYKSNWFAIPDAGIGAVVLTNAGSGDALLGPFSRRLLEVIYDGKEEAVETVSNVAARQGNSREKLRSELTHPADPKVVAGLADRYANPDLGPLTVSREGGKVRVASTSIGSEIATKANQDGSVSLVMIDPGVTGLGLLVGTRDRTRTLTLNDGQHEYVFVER
jgi:CubicO group peptidase (beta-lactamase class C family)